MGTAADPARSVQPPALPDRAREVSAGLPYPFLRSQADWVAPAVALTAVGPVLSTDAWSGRHLGVYDGTAWTRLTDGPSWFRGPCWEEGGLSALVYDDPAREESARRTLRAIAMPRHDASQVPRSPNFAGLDRIPRPPATRIVSSSAAPGDSGHGCVLLARGAARRLVALSPQQGRSLDAPVTSIGPWLSPDEVLITIEEWPARRLHSWNTRTGELTSRLTGDEDGVIGDLLAGAGQLAMTWTSPRQPRRLLLFDERRFSTVGAPQGLTTDAAGGPVPPPPETVVLTAAAGHRLPCLVQPAVEPTRGTVVLLHGGPNGAHLGTWSPLADSLALHGWRVVRPNVRGSSVLDRSVRPPAPRMYGVDDAEDVAEVVRLLGTGPVAVGGVSYGGYLAARTARRVEVQGVFSLGGFLRMADISGSTHPEVRGFLDTLAQRLAPDEPLAEIPHFIAHGRLDARIPIAAMTDYRRRLTADSRLIVIDGEGHGIVSDHAARIAFAELFDWLDGLCAL